MTGDFDTALQEILDALSGYGWSQTQVEVEVQRGKVSLETKWGSAANIFNVAEQNILGLASLFTAYLYVGKRWSKAVFINDPFQNLDDGNLYGYIRLFDDVALAVGASQIVIALHRPTPRDHFVTHFADKAGESGEFVLLELFHSSELTSDVDPRKWGYRRTSVS